MLSLHFSCLTCFRYSARNPTYSGPVLCSHPQSVIIPEVSPEVYSLMSMVEPVREAISSTERHNIAAPHFSNYRCA